MTEFEQFLAHGMSGSEVDLQTGKVRLLTLAELEDIMNHPERFDVVEEVNADRMWEKYGKPAEEAWQAKMQEMNNYYQGATFK